MHSQAHIEKVAIQLLESQGLVLVSCKNLQTLWAGYGHICAIEAVGKQTPATEPLSLILKFVSPPVKSGTTWDEGRLRKIISYQVEQHFYSHLAPSMPKEIAVASCLASIDAHDPSGNITAMILADLRIEFPVAGESRGQLKQKQVNAALDWLAAFHGFWWTRSHSLLSKQLRLPPLDEARQASIDNKSSTTRQGSVWLNGGYTYLATRKKEFADLAQDDSEWVEKLCSPSNDCLAEKVARFLTPSVNNRSTISDYQTLIHGDVKSENLFTTTNGDAVAFFDFQYVGLGLGVCDLAKLFTCSLPEQLLVEGALDGSMHSFEELLLHRYLSKLEAMSGKKYEWATFVRHWETALVDWLRFQASWGFWGNTEWLEARVRKIVEDVDWRLWLDQNQIQRK